MVARPCILRALKWRPVTLKLAYQEEHVPYHLGIEKTRFDYQMIMQVLLQISLMTYQSDRQDAFSEIIMWSQ